MKTIALAWLALAIPAQVPKEPAKDLFMHSAQAPGVEMRFVDYHWQPALFEAMEKGSGAIPEATRNWVIARVILNSRPLTFGTARLPVGNYALVLWPNLDGKGMADRDAPGGHARGLPGRERDRSRPDAARRCTRGRRSSRRRARSRRGSTPR